MIEIYAIRINGILDESISDRLLKCLSKQKGERVKSYCDIKEAQRVLVADILVRIIICSKLQLRNIDLNFGLNEFGKPYLTNSNDLFFNVSHSKEWVVCAFHCFPIGVDIEQIRPINFELARRFYSENEYNDLMEKDVSERQSYFFDLWSLKESYIKAIGKGLSIPLNAFSIRYSDGIYLETSNPDKFYFTQYAIDSRYKLAICSSTTHFSNKVIILDQNIIFEEDFMKVIVNEYQI